VFVAQRVGQDEGVEDVVLAAGDAVSLASASGDARVDGEHAVTACLQVLDQQALGPFQAHRQAAAEPSELGVELVQSGDVVAEPDLPQPLAGAADGAELMVAAAPVDADEDLVRAVVVVLLSACT
jgi:hypothetical protein